MSALLARVCWPAVCRTLAGATGQRQVVPTHERFADLVLAEGPVMLRITLGRAGLGEDIGGAELLAHWLRSTAHLVLAADVAAIDPPDPHPPTPGQLDLHPALAGLPLLDLAADVAELGGGLRVVARALPPGAAGRCSGRLIELDPVQAGERLHQVWAHELGHRLDGWQHDDEQRERFADELGALMLEHQPTRFAGAWVLANRAHETVASTPRFTTSDGRALDVLAGQLPAPGPASVSAFRSLPLDEEQVAA